MGKGRWIAAAHARTSSQLKVCGQSTPQRAADMATQSHSGEMLERDLPPRTNKHKPRQESELSASSMSGTASEGFFLWDRSQPITFASEQSRVDRTWRPCTPITFAGTTTTNPSDTRSFSTGHNTAGKIALKDFQPSEKTFPKTAPLVTRIRQAAAEKRQMEEKRRRAQTKERAILVAKLKAVQEAERNKSAAQKDAEMAEKRAAKLRRIEELHAMQAKSKEEEAKFLLGLEAVENEIAQLKRVPATYHVHGRTTKLLRIHIAESIQRDLANLVKSYKDEIVSARHDNVERRLLQLKVKIRLLEKEMDGIGAAFKLEAEQRLQAESNSHYRMRNLLMEDEKLRLEKDAEEAALQAAFQAAMDAERAEEEAEYNAAVRAAQRVTYSDYRDMFDALNSTFGTLKGAFRVLLDFHKDRLRGWEDKCRNLQNCHNEISAGTASLLTHNSSNSKYQSINEMAENVGNIINDILNDASSISKLYQCEYEFWFWHFNKVMEEIRAVHITAHGSRRATRWARHVTGPKSEHSHWRLEFYTPWRTVTAQWRILRDNLLDLIAWSPPSPYKQKVELYQFIGKKFDDQKREALGSAFEHLLDETMRRLRQSNLIDTGNNMGERLLVSRLQKSSLARQEYYRVVMPFQEFSLHMEQLKSGVQNMYHEILYNNRDYGRTIPRLTSAYIKWMAGWAQYHTNGIRPAMLEATDAIYERIQQEEALGLLQPRAEELSRYLSTQLQILQDRDGNTSSPVFSKKIIRRTPRAVVGSNRRPVSTNPKQVTNASAGKSEPIASKMRRAGSNFKSKSLGGHNHRDRSGHSPPSRSTLSDSKHVNRPQRRRPMRNVLSKPNSLVRKIPMNEDLSKIKGEKSEFRTWKRPEGTKEEEQETQSSHNEGERSPSFVAFSATLPKKIHCDPRLEPNHSSSEAATEGEREEYTALTFQIPDGNLRAAMLASKSTTAAYWSHTLYRGPSGQAIPVHYCRSKDTSEKVAQMFLGRPVLGFDIEWKPQAKADSGIKNNVSLLQLACEERIGLFHLALHKGEVAEDILPPTLKAILESSTITKVGVAIMADFSRLNKYLGITPAGLIELSHLHNLVTYSISNPAKVTKKLVSLADQVEAHLRLPLSKGEVRTSDWSKPLNHEQSTYAAADAYASFRVYYELEAKRVVLDPRPPRPAFAELKLPIQLAASLADSDASSDVETSESGESSADEEIESLNKELEQLSLGSIVDKEQPNSHMEVRNSDWEDLSDEELQGLGLASNADEIDHLTERGSLTDPAIGGVADSDVQYPTLPNLEDEIESSEPEGGTLVGRLSFSDQNLLPQDGGEYPPDTDAQLNKDRMLDGARRWAQDQAPSKGTSSSTSHRSTISPWAKPNKVNVSSLQAYYLWVHYELSVEEVGSVLRDPPLKNGTVATYVAECLLFQGLQSSNQTRVRELFRDIPYAAQGRYQELKKAAFAET